MKRIAAILLTLVSLTGLLPLFNIDTGAAFTGDDKVTIVIDPGHGGYNVGASARGVGEKTYTMRLATLLRDELLANGSFNVYLTRTGDYDLELYQRAEVANNYNADLLISLHFDGNPSSSVNGVTTYTSIFDEYASYSLSASIASKVSAAVGLRNNGVRRRADTEGYYWNSQKQWDCQDSSLGILSDYYGIPTWAAKFGMKSIIVEHGYFSNAHDVSLLFADGALEKIAKAEAEAIIAHYTNHVHVYSAAKRDFPSNCVYTGKQSEHCSVCGHRKNVSLLAPDTANHYWVTKSSTPASCGVDGKTIRECRITQNLADKGWTGEIHTETVTTPAPSQHTFELKKQVDATHTVDGYKLWGCKTCSYSFKDILKAEGHTYEFAGYTEPTCTKTGGNSYKCKVCSHTYTDTEPAKGHDFDVVTTIEPTCTKSGEQQRKCKVCSFEATDAVAPLDHHLPYGAKKEPSCTEDGFRKGTCSRCGEKIDEVLEKKEHSWITKSSTPPTCETPGSLITSCSVCSTEAEESIPATNHSYKLTSKSDANCMQDGISVYTCESCSKSYEEKEDKKDHAKGEQLSHKDAGIFTAGRTEYSCKYGCGEIIAETVPPRLDKKIALMASGAAALLISLSLLLILIITSRKKSKADPAEAQPEEAAPLAEAETEAEVETEVEADTIASAEATENE